MIKKSTPSKRFCVTLEGKAETQTNDKEGGIVTHTHPNPEKGLKGV